MFCLVNIVTLFYLTFLGKSHSCEVTDGFNAIDTLLDGCYLVSQEEASWEGAEQHCQERGGHLISTRTQDLIALVISSLKTTNKISQWIGLKKHDLDDWEWSDGTVVGDTQWAAGEPSMAGSGLPPEECVLLDAKNNFRWANELCSKQDAGALCSFGMGDPMCTVPGATVYEYPRSGLCYVLIQDSVSWFRARRECLENGGDLIKINNTGLFEYLQNRLQQDKEQQKLWVSLRKSTWIWSTGIEVKAAFWIAGKPNSPYGCGALYESSQNKIGWDAAKCDTKMKYICEVPDKAPVPSGQPSVTPSIGGGSSAGLTGGLVVLVLVLVLILVAIIVLFFMYKRRGSLLRTRARAAAIARRAAPPAQKAEGNPRDLFYVNNNGAPRYEPDYSDVGATSDKAKIVEQAEGMATSCKPEVQMNTLEGEEEPENHKGRTDSSYAEEENEDLQKHVSDESGTVEDSKDKPRNQEPNISPHSSENFSNLNENDGNSDIVSGNANLNQGYEPDRISDTMDEHWASPPSKSKKLPMDLNAEISTDESKTEAPDILISTAANSDSAQDQDKIPTRLMEQHQNEPSEEKSSPVRLKVMDPVAMEEFDESELLSPRFREVDLPSSRTLEPGISPDLGALKEEDGQEEGNSGLMELDASDIMTPRGMPMGKTLKLLEEDKYIEL